MEPSIAWYGSAAACALILALLTWLYIAWSNPKARSSLPALPSGASKALFVRHREDAFLQLTARFGPTFGYDGVPATADPGLLRAILLSRAHSLGRPLVYRLVARVMPWSDGILFSPHEQWRTRHGLFTPLFSGGHTRKFTAHMTASALIVAALQAEGAGGTATATGSDHTAEDEDEGLALLTGATCSSCVSTALNGQQKQRHKADFCACMLLPLGAPLHGFHPCHGSSGDRAARQDLLSSMRWVSLRLLLAWGCGLDPDAHGTHPELEARGYKCACEPAKRVARCVDAYARLCFEVMPGCGPLRWTRNYWRLWSVGRMLRATVKHIVELEGVLWARPASKGPAAAGDLSSAYSNASLARRHGACVAGTDGSAASVLAPCPVLSAYAEGRRPAEQAPLRKPQACDTFLGRMVAAGWSVDDITSELNHLHGAHKAAAFMAVTALTELSARPDVLQRLRRELAGVCGAPAAVLLSGETGSPGAGTQKQSDSSDAEAWLHPLLSHVRAVVAGSATDNSTADADVGGCAFGCGWRPPSKDDLEGPLPTLKQVWKESLRHHVVSMGTMRKLGEDLRVKLLAPDASGSGSSPSSPSNNVIESVLPAGSDVLLLLHAVHHDPSLWGPHPHHWLPERWDPHSTYWRGLRAEQGTTEPGAECQHSTPQGRIDLPPKGELPHSYSTAFMPFLEGMRRCAGMYTAELQFASYLYAWLVLCDVRATLPPSTDPDTGTPSGTSIGNGTCVSADEGVITGAVTARRGALCWIQSNGGSSPEALPAALTQRRLGIVKRADMFTGLDGHVPFTVRL